MPLEGRDQNSRAATMRTAVTIPQCPWRGEIKTPRMTPRMPPRRYHNALGGARSKHAGSEHLFHASDTTMPLEGRDQNDHGGLCRGGRGIPQCPWRGEIKTHRCQVSPRRQDTTMPLEGRDQNGRRVNRYALRSGVFYILTSVAIHPPPVSNFPVQKLKNMKPSMKKHFRVFRLFRG